MIELRILYPVLFAKHKTNSRILYQVLYNVFKYSFTDSWPILPACHINVFSDSCSNAPNQNCNHFTDSWFCRSWYFYGFLMNTLSCFYGFLKDTIRKTSMKLHCLITDSRSLFFLSPLPDAFTLRPRQHGGGFSSHFHNKLPHLPRIPRPLRSSQRPRYFLDNFSFITIPALRAYSVSSLYRQALWRGQSDCRGFQSWNRL